MKRTSAVFFVLLLCIAFCTGCKSKEERELEEAREAVVEMSQAYKDQLRELNKLNRNTAAYKRSIEQLNNAK